MENVVPSPNYFTLPHLPSPLKHQIPPSLFSLISLCHKPEFGMLLLQGTVSHQPSKLGPSRSIYLCYQVQASPLSHSGLLVLMKSQSSFQETVWLF